MKTQWKLRVSMVCMIIAIVGTIALLAINVSPCHAGQWKSLATIDRIDGFNMQWRGFTAVKGDDFKEISTDIMIRVIVVANQNDVGSNAVATYSPKDNTIRVYGKLVNGRILLCPAVLGHEVQHALEYQSEGFVNPDKSEGYGY